MPFAGDFHFRPDAGVGVARDSAAQDNDDGRLRHLFDRLRRERRLQRRTDQASGYAARKNVQPQERRDAAPRRRTHCPDFQQENPEGEEQEFNANGTQQKPDGFIQKVHCAIPRDGPSGG